MEVSFNEFIKYIAETTLLDSRINDSLFLISEHTGNQPTFI